jgi:hypothetical protein
MLDYRKQVEALLQEREESSLGKWKSNETELTARAKYEEDVRAKYHAFNYNLVVVDFFNCKKIFSIDGKAKGRV